MPRRLASKSKEHAFAHPAWLLPAVVIGLVGCAAPTEALTGQIEEDSPVSNHFRSTTYCRLDRDLLVATAPPERSFKTENDWYWCLRYENTDVQSTFPGSLSEGLFPIFDAYANARASLCRVLVDSAEHVTDRQPAGARCWAGGEDALAALLDAWVQLRSGESTVPVADGRSAHPGCYAAYDAATAGDAAELALAGCLEDDLRAERDELAVRVGRRDPRQAPAVTSFLVGRELEHVIESGQAACKVLAEKGKPRDAAALERATLGCRADAAILMSALIATFDEGSPVAPGLVRPTLPPQAHSSEASWCDFSKDARPPRTGAWLECLERANDAVVGTIERGLSTPGAVTSAFDAYDLASQALCNTFDGAAASSTDAPADRPLQVERCRATHQRALADLIDAWADLGLRSVPIPDAPEAFPGCYEANHRAIMLIPGGREGDTRQATADLAECLESDVLSQSRTIGGSPDVTRALADRIARGRSVCEVLASSSDDGSALAGCRVDAALQLASIVGQAQP